ncbi:MAG: STAS/SEC14 domain-containing protein [Bacteroidota bacterium]
MVIEIDSPTVVFENTAGTAKILHHPLERTFEIALIGKIDQADYQEAFLTYLELTESRGYQIALFNNSHLEEDTMQSRAWFIANFLPRSMKRIRSIHYRAAVVAPINRFQRMITEMVAKGARALGKPMTVEFFDSTTDALRWLASAPSPAN